MRNKRTCFGMTKCTLAQWEEFFPNIYGLPLLLFFWLKWTVGQPKFFGVKSADPHMEVWVKT